MVKALSLIVYTLLLVWFVARFSYEKGSIDQMAKATYMEAANTYTTLYMLRNKSSDEVIEFYESTLDFNVEVHKFAADNQSFLHPFFKMEELKPNTEYYMHIREYRNKYPSKEDNSKILMEINSLIDSEDKTF
jgi:hypothetical protein